MSAQAITTAEGVRVAVGQHWRQDDGYLCRVVGFASHGWPAVRHVNAKYAPSSMVNPAWFARWTLTKDAS